MILGELDARANVENIEAVIDASTMRLLLVRNATHDLGRSVSSKLGDKLDDIEARFLADGSWPPEDLVLDASQ